MSIGIPPDDVGRGGLGGVGGKAIGGGWSIKSGVS